MIPLALLTWLKAHWRPVAAVAAVLGAYALGHFTVPTKTVTVDRVEWKERVVTQTVTQAAEAKTETKTLVVYRDTVTHKDGSTETKSETRAVSGTQESATQDTTTHVDAVSEGTKLATTTVGAAGTRNWYLGVDIGVPVSLHSPFAGTPFVIVDLSRHLIGPLQAGAWGSIDLNGKNPAFGLSVGVSL